MDVQDVLALIEFPDGSDLSNLVAVHAASLKLQKPGLFELKSENGGSSDTERSDLGWEVMRSLSSNSMRCHRCTTPLIGSDQKSPLKCQACEYDGPPQVDTLIDRAKASLARIEKRKAR